MVHIPLDVFHHKVLARELEVVREVVDDLAVIQAVPRIRVEDALHSMYCGPIELPVLVT